MGVKGYFKIIEVIIAALLLFFIVGIAYSAVPNTDFDPSAKLLTIDDELREKIVEQNKTFILETVREKNPQLDEFNVVVEFEPTTLTAAGDIYVYSTFISGYDTYKPTTLYVYYYK